MKNSFEIFSRLIDILISSFLILLFSPIMILICICIFKSVFVENNWRVGKGGKLFLMYKFRTMIPNAHELIENDERFAYLKRLRKENNGKIPIKDDVRITKFGKFLRKTDLDELPQLFNVFKGEMSLVGPRAYFEEEIKEFNMKNILKLKPGITGLWQVSGRNLLSLEKRVECDIVYYEKRSFWLDLYILFKTPYVVLTRYGACD